MYNPKGGTFLTRRPGVYHPGWAALFPHFSYKVLGVLPRRVWSQRSCSALLFSQLWEDLRAFRKWESISLRLSGSVGIQNHAVAEAGPCALVHSQGHLFGWTGRAHVIYLARIEWMGQRLTCSIGDSDLGLSFSFLHKITAFHAGVFDPWSPTFPTLSLCESKLLGRGLINKFL